MERYEKYKDSGVDWIGKIPEGWEVVPIKYSLEIPVTDGPHETPEILNEGIPFLSAEAVKNDKLDFNKKRGYISNSDHERFSLKYKPQRGDVYMVKSGATTGNIGRVETDEEFSIWSPLAALRPDFDVMLTNFLFFFMKSRPFLYSVELGWNYGTQQNIGMGVISNLLMTRPSKPEQTAIANYLDRKTAEIDQLIAQKEHLLELYEEEKIAIINQAVTQGINPDVKLKESGIDWLGEIPEHWVVKKLKYVADLASGNNLTSEQIEPVGNYRVYGGNGLRGYNKNFTHEGRFVLIGRQGALCGNIHYAKNKFWATDHAVVATPIIKYELVWFGELLRVMNLNQYSVAAAQPGLSVDSIKNLSIPFPLLSEQSAIVKHIETQTSRINAKIAKTEKIIILQKEYRTALISEVVTGKIKVTQKKHGEITAWKI